MTKIFATLLACTLALNAAAQAFSSEIELISDNGSSITLQATASDPKKKDAENLAIQSAFNALLATGIEGVRQGMPMMAQPKPDYTYRLFTEKRYLNYIDGVPKKIASKKVGDNQRVTVELTIKLKPLLADLERNKVVLSPVWQDQKKVEATVALNPTIVVVPCVNGGVGDFEAMRKHMAEDPLSKYAVQAVQSEFTKRGYKTRDFVAMLQNSSTNELLHDGTQSDIATKIVQQLPGDIVVTVDPVVYINGNRGSCAISIKAVEKQTAGNLSTASFASKEYLKTDSVALCNYAIAQASDDFFKGLSAAFETMVDKGREVVMEITISSTVDDWTFEDESPATGTPFMVALEEWMRANANKQIYDAGNNSTDKYIRATINVPLWDKKKNRSYSLTDFGRDVRSFFKTELGDDYKAKVTALGQRLDIVIE